MSVAASPPLVAVLEVSMANPYLAMSRPRLYRQRGRWFCVTRGCDLAGHPMVLAAGFGATPIEAYKEWHFALYEDAMRSANITLAKRIADDEVRLRPRLERRKA